LGLIIPLLFGPQSLEVPEGIVPGTNTLSKLSFGPLIYLNVISKVSEKDIDVDSIKKSFILLTLYFFEILLKIIYHTIQVIKYNHRSKTNL